MEIRRRGAITVPQSPAAVLAVLRDGDHLAEWNPAFTSSSGATDAVDGSQVRITVRGLPGTLRYDHVSRDRVAMSIWIPGLSETGNWWLEQVPSGTRATHEFLQTGALARLLEPATRGVANLRVDRLARRLEEPHQRIS